MGFRARPTMGAPDPMYFMNSKSSPTPSWRPIYRGIEANILDFNGAVDVDAAMASRLDYVIASLHPHHLVGDEGREHTRPRRRDATPFVAIIGHRTTTAIRSTTRNSPPRPRERVARS